MVNQFTWDVVLRIATEGGPQSHNQMKLLKKAEEELQNQTTSLKTAQEGLNKALAKQETEKAASGLDKMGAAQLRLQRATEDRAAAERKLASTGKGDPAAQARATSELTRAVDNQTRAQGALDRANRSSTESTNSLRYANYDLAQTMFTVSAAVTAVGGATLVAFAQQERAFTNVERTAEGALGGIRDTLTELSTTLPLAFTDLAGIATLGNQLGVASQDLEKFTETVASFSTATGITAEASAQAFGRIGNILDISASDYDRLASAIVYTGRTSAATEKEIISLTERLGASADRAGFAESEVIGLAGALGSVAVAPERAQGVFETYFNTLNESLAEGGRRAELFAQVVGVSVEELNNMVRGGQGLDVFRRFATTLGDPANDTVELTNALSELGLSGLRANEVIGRISQRMGLFDRSMQNANKAYTENTELQTQMALILDDLATKWSTTVNAVVNLAAAFGGTLAPVIGPILDGFKTLVISVTDFINTPIGSNIARIAAILAGATAAFTLYRGAVALSTATTYALITAQRGLAASGATSAMGGLAAALGLVGGASGTAAGGLTVLRAALTRLLAATGVGAVLLLVGGAVVDLRGTLQGLIGFMQGTYNTVTKYFNGFRTAIGVLAGVTNIFVDVTRIFVKGNELISRGAVITSQVFESLATRVKLASFAIGTTIDFLAKKFGVLGRIAQVVLSPITGAVKKFGEGFSAGAGFFDNNVNLAFDELNKLAGLLPSTLDDGTSSVETLTDSLGGLTGGLGDVGGGLDTATKKMRTLTDYTNDLSSVWGRAFDIRFGPQKSLDAITTSFQGIRDAAAEAQRTVRSLNAEISGINSDLGIQKYFLGIAESYGDEKRAAAIRAQIASLESDLATKTEERSKAQADASKTLTGNSEAAIKNRGDLFNLVQQYQEHIKTLSASGLSTEQLKAATSRLEQDFISQATQLGYNRNELSLYVQSFRDVKVAIDNVPRDITVNFDADPAIQAFNEFAAQAAQQASSAGYSAGNNFSTQFANSLAAGIPTTVEIKTKTGTVGVAGRNRVGFAEGGYTGPGGKYDAAGIVHRGEYVIPKHLVNQATGLPYADAMGRLQRGAPSRRGYAGGGFVQGGGNNGHIASFGPMAAMQLAQALATQVTLQDGTIAGAVGRQNAWGSANGNA